MEVNQIIKGDNLKVLTNMPAMTNKKWPEKKKIDPSKIKTELYHDNFQNYKKYGIPKAQLVIADIPYNIGINAYGSSTEWYIDGDNKKGESNKAGKQFFNSDKNFNLVEYMHFCSTLLTKELKEKNKAPAMIVFCAFNQMQMLIDVGKKYGFNNGYPILSTTEDPGGYHYPANRREYFEWKDREMIKAKKQIAKLRPVGFGVYRYFRKNMIQQAFDFGKRLVRIS